MKLSLFVWEVDSDRSLVDYVEFEASVAWGLKWEVTVMTHALILLKILKLHMLEQPRNKRHNIAITVPLLQLPFLVLELFGLFLKEPRLLNQLLGNHSSLIVSSHLADIELVQRLLFFLRN